MSKREIRPLLQIAFQLVDHLPVAINDDLKKLLLKTREDYDLNTEIEIIDLLSTFEGVRALIRSQSDLQGEKDAILGDHFSSMSSKLAGSRLAGTPNWIPSSQKWVCLEDGCDRWLLVIQESEAPPVCEKHKTKMVRGEKRKG